jgi:hypothetical protein
MSCTSRAQPPPPHHCSPLLPPLARRRTGTLGTCSFAASTSSSRCRMHCRRLRARTRHAHSFSAFPRIFLFMHMVYPPPLFISVTRFIPCPPSQSASCVCVRFVKAIYLSVLCVTLLPDLWETHTPAEVAMYAGVAFAPMLGYLYLAQVWPTPSLSLLATPLFSAHHPPEIVAWSPPSLVPPILTPHSMRSHFLSTSAPSALSAPIATRTR